MFNEESDKLINRTKQQAIQIIKALKNIEKDMSSQILARQLVRSCTSVAANYRSCLRAKSKADFVPKISTVVEESDETLFWLDMLYETNYLQKDIYSKLHTESLEILKIMSKARSTAVKNK